MNDGFFKLPKEKRIRIINAGFKVFSENIYRKAPVAMIAAEAGISKSLLFYYFKNKKELYLYLWEKAVAITKGSLRKQKTMETEDFFEILCRSLKAKCRLIAIFPYVAEFSFKAYYESDPDVVEEIQASFQMLQQESYEKTLKNVDWTAFREDIDLELMYQEMVWTSDGLIRKMRHSGKLDPEQIEMIYDRLIEMWKRAYLK